MKNNFEQPSASENDQPVSQEEMETKDRENLDSLIEKAEKSETADEISEQASEESEARDTQGSYCGSGHGCMGSHYCASY